MLTAVRDGSWTPPGILERTLRWRRKLGFWWAPLSMFTQVTLCLSGPGRSSLLVAGSATATALIKADPAAPMVAGPDAVALPGRAYLFQAKQNVDRRAS
jgi:hypothetical protein